MRRLKIEIKDKMIYKLMAIVDKALKIITHNLTINKIEEDTKDKILTLDIVVEEVEEVVIKNINRNLQEKAATNQRTKIKSDINHY